MGSIFGKKKLFAKLSDLMAAGSGEVKQFVLDNSGKPMIDAASNNGKLSIDLMLSCGVDVNYICEGETALSSAVKHGHYDLVKFLFEKGASVALVPDIICVSVMYHDNREMIDLLLKNGADINIVTEYNGQLYDALMLALGKESKRHGFSN